LGVCFNKAASEFENCNKEQIGDERPLSAIPAFVKRVSLISQRSEARSSLEWTDLSEIRPKTTAPRVRKSKVRVMAVVMLVL
jgi:hypothetical protein